MKSDTTETPEAGSGFFHRFRRALPSWADVWRGGIVWAIAMFAAAMAGLWFYFRGISGKEYELATIYLLGGLFAWPFALYVTRFMALGCSPPVRFVLALVIIAGCTLAMTAFVFSQQFRLIFADTHMPITTRIGLYQFAETSASGVFQFLVAGVRLYFPVGILALVIASLWLARRMR
ncbi:hypothetical protein [Rhizobium sp. L1K21]|uniref:hypothetical protein n=1 Tax=Rhizobium sp. L1K21 TaxID=2954933 RepID=UPI00209323F9|nr:hypothetical protein [Rhizobium sp. L1K21]MCO6185886.1 hypothetical protein [Rhizobium sp. L1K21]